MTKEEIQTIINYTKSILTNSANDIEESRTKIISSLKDFIKAVENKDKSIADYYTHIAKVMTSVSQYQAVCTVIYMMIQNGEALKREYENSSTSNSDNPVTSSDVSSGNRTDNDD